MELSRAHRARLGKVMTMTGRRGEKRGLGVSFRYWKEVALQEEKVPGGSEAARGERHVC